MQIERKIAEHHCGTYLITDVITVSCKFKSRMTEHRRKRGEEERSEENNSTIELFLILQVEHYKQT